MLIFRNRKKSVRLMERSSIASLTRWSSLQYALTGETHSTMSRGSWVGGFTFLDNKGLTVFSTDARQVDR